MDPAQDRPHVTVTHLQPGEAPVEYSGTLLPTPVNTGADNPPCSASPTPSNDGLQERDEWQRQRWEDAVNRNMDIVDGYARVGVLLVKWEDGLDQLRVSEEVDELEAVFRDTYHYETRRLELHNRTKPQHQLSLGIAEFVTTYDDPSSRNLMIVYYSGHGVWFKDKGHLELEATDDYNKDGRAGYPRPHPPRASWNEVEYPLLNSDTDVLAIFDCCMASNLMRRGGNTDINIPYEFLAASAPDLPTERPGPESFTKALIHALKKLAEENAGRSFTTWYLHQMICDQREKNTSFLWNRRRHDDGHIRLKPVSQVDSSAKPASPTKQTDPNVTYLTLKFRIQKRKLDEDDIEELTKRVPKAFNEAGVKCDRIDYVSDRPRRGSPRWREAAERIIHSTRVLKNWPQSVQSPIQEKVGREEVNSSRYPSAHIYAPGVENDGTNTPRFGDSRRGSHTDETGHLSPTLKTQSKQRQRYS